HRQVRLHAQVGQRDHAVGADPDEGLLAHRDQAAEPGQQVPHARQGHQDVEVHERVGDVAEDHVRQGREQHHGGEERTAGQLGGARGAAHVHVGGRPLGQKVGEGHAVRPASRPCGRKASTARKTRWPASSVIAGSICAPSDWVTPSTMPPSSVPQSEPRPPITTASNAKISRDGPVAGSKDERIANISPASATVAKAMAVATPYTCRLSAPTRFAVSRSSEEARSIRPSPVRDRNTWMPASTAQASRNVTSGSQPTVMEPASWNEEVANAPPSKVRVSAEKISRSTFCSTIESPNVTSSVASGPDERLPCSSARWVR